MSEEQNAPPVVKKRVKHYPILVSLMHNNVKKPVDVVVLNVTGFIARLTGHVIVQVGEYYDLEMLLPVGGHGVMTKCRVLKTYDKSLDPKEHIIERIAEFHFEKLSTDHKAAIQDFVRVAGQK